MSEAEKLAICSYRQEVEMDGDTYVLMCDLPAGHEGPHERAITND